MLKKYAFILIVVVTTVSSCAQEVKKEAKIAETKMEAFSSKTGVITKFTDSNLPNLKTAYAEVAETRIRKLSNGATAAYFYQIEKAGKYNSSTASIEYSDLLEVIKALKTLKSEVEKDISSNPDYLENKFVTVDGFQIGYYVSKGKATWYVKLEKHGSDSTLFVGIDAIDAALNEAKIKIEQLKG